MTGLNLNTVLAVPYQDRGLDLNGWNCWGLVRWVFHALHGIWLPAYAEVSPDADQTKSQAALDVIRDGDFRTVKRPREGDIAAAYCGGGRWLKHIGIVVRCDGRLWVLHAAPSRGGRLSTITAFERAYLSVKWWRHG